MHGDADELRPRGAPTDDDLADFALGTLDEYESKRIADAIATDPAVAGRAKSIRRALDALAEGLEPSELPPGGLERLLRAARDDRAHGDARKALRPGPPAMTPRSLARPPRRAGLRMVNAAAGLLVVALVALTGAFAAIQASQVATVREEQRVLAYWMANPDMTLIALEEPLGADAAWSDDAWTGSEDAGRSADAGRHGVVCLLPDGRGLILRPGPAPDGGVYQVVGDGSSGETELARGGGNVLLFDAAGIERVEIRVLDARRGGVVGVVDRVVRLFGGRLDGTRAVVGDGTVVARARLP